jgi:uncharacterized protein (DUF302 family)
MTRSAASCAYEIVTKISSWSVEETVNRLSAVVAARGMKLFAVIDHSGGAEAAGPLAALDLPLKVLVWDDHGRTTVNYRASMALAARYELRSELEKHLAGINLVTDAALER